MELPDKNNKLKKLYLYREKIRVPKYFWKLVYDPKTSRGIGIITSNNPYLGRNATLKICKDICQENNWLNYNATIEWKDSSKGLTICCSVTEMRKLFEEVPYVEVDGVLSGPHAPEIRRIEGRRPEYARGYDDDD